MSCSQVDKNVVPVPWTSNLYACLTLRIQLWATEIAIFFSIKCDVQKKWIIAEFCSWRNKIFEGIFAFLVFS